MIDRDEERTCLIGPELYGAYGMTLKVALFGIGAAAVVVALVKTAGPAAGLLEPLFALARVWIQGAFIAFGTVTLAFALLQGSPAARARFVTRWRRSRWAA
jgi:hypothetical protein